MDNVTLLTVNIRDEYALISAFMRGLHESERELNSRTALWDDIEVAYMRHIIAMQEEYDGLCIVAYADGKPAGVIMGYIEEEDDSRFEEPAGDMLYISDGYVKPEYRRMGVYRMLNRAIEKHYTSRGIRRIYRFTLCANSGMRKLLEQEGYMATRVLYEKWL